MKRLVEKETFTCTKEQKETLNKLQKLGFKKSVFIRIAIAEKINRDYKELQPKPKKEYCPF